MLADELESRSWRRGLIASRKQIAPLEDLFLSVVKRRDSPWRRATRGGILVVGHFANGKLAPSPVAPATGRLYRFSARRKVPREAGQAAGLSSKINIVKVTHYRNSLPLDSRWCGLQYERTPEEAERAQAMNLTIASREAQGVTIRDLSGRLVMGQECNSLREQVTQLLGA